MSDSIAVDSMAELPQRNFLAWLVCLSAGLFFFYEFFQLNIFDVINQPLRQDFNLDAASLSFMSSTYLWADLLFLIPAGFILDKYSPRVVILIAMLVCVLGTAGFALTSSYWLASFCHFLSGIGNAFCFLACVVLVSRWFPPRRQAFMIGLIVTMAFLGGMMAHTPFAYLSEVYGWRQALLIDAVVGFFLLAWIYFVVQDSPNELDNQTMVNEKATSFAAALKNKQNWVAGLYTCFLNLPIMVLCALWGASYLQVVHHIAELPASNIISLIFVGSIIGCPLVGWLSDNQGKRKPLMVIGAVASLVVVIPLVMDIPLSPFMLSILFFCLGFFTSTQVISYPLIAESNPVQNIGTATGFASLLIMGGAGIGQLLFGWLMRYHAGVVEQYNVADFQFAMWIFPLTVGIALAAIFFTRETYCRPLN